MTITRRFVNVTTFFELTPSNFDMLGVLAFFRVLGIGKHILYFSASDIFGNCLVFKVIMIVYCHTDLSVTRVNCIVLLEK